MPASGGDGCGGCARPRSNLPDHDHAHHPAAERVRTRRAPLPGGQLTAARRLGLTVSLACDDESPWRTSLGRNAARGGA